MRGDEDYRSERSADGRVPLEDTRCRYLLYCLYLCEGPIRLSDVAQQVSIWERGTETSERPQIYRSLYREHLPELTAAGVVEYDQQAEVVELGPDRGDVEEPLERRLCEEIDALLRAEAEALRDDSCGQSSNSNT